MPTSGSTHNPEPRSISAFTSFLHCRQDIVASNYCVIIYTVGKHLRKKKPVNLTPLRSYPDGAGISELSVKSLHRRDVILLVGACCIAAILAFVGLTNHMLWDDEANTALFGRTFLKTGTVTGIDGDNIIGFRQGAELDENLINTYEPPLHYWVAAGSMALFGETTFGARFLFVVGGLLALIPLFFWVQWHFSGSLPPWVPVLLVAVSPAYLLYIRQCRYYPLVMLFTVIFLALYAHPKTTRRAAIITSLSGGVTAILLMLTNYLNAVAIAGFLLLFLLLPRYRHRNQYLFMGSVYAAFLFMGVYILLTANPFAHAVAGDSAVKGIARFGVLMWFHIKDLGSFEFFPLLVPFILLSFFAFKSLGAGRILAREGMLIILGMLFYIGVTIIFSPQPVSVGWSFADMRYVVPLILIGAVVTSCAIYALWQCGKPLWKVFAVSIAILVLTTNVLSLGFIGKQPLTSTLYRYVRENLNYYKTGTEALITYLRQLPQGKVVAIVPDHMMYSAQFYAPEQRYCCQLNPDHPLRNDLRSQLPDYIFTGRTRPDYILVGGSTPPPMVLAYFENIFGVGWYRIREVLPDDWRDMSRPEIAWHSFGPPEEDRFGKQQRGFVVLEKTK